MTERYGRDSFYRAFLSSIWYNYDVELIKSLYEKVIESLESDYLPIHDVDDFWQDNDGANILWCQMVEMFGDCGTSPRIGWLSKAKAKGWITDLYTDLKEMEEQ